MTRTATRTPPRRTGNRWPDNVRTQAIATATEHGLAQATRTTGVPKSTIARWLDADGTITRGDVTGRFTDKTREATAASVARRAQLRAEALEQIVDKLTVAANQALDATLAALNGGVPRGEATRHPSLAVCRPSELVGIWTRAIHDLQLLTGEDTERGAATGVVHVYLAKLDDDDAKTGPVIIDVTPDPVASRAG